MPKSQSLASMSVDALLKMRDDIGKALSARMKEARGTLARLEGSMTGAKRRGPKPRRKGKKAAAKYRGPKGETWAGRGLRPRWLTALVKQGRKIEEFSVDRAKRR